MRIVPRTGAPSAESQAPGQLPRVDEDHVEGYSLPGAPAPTVVEVEIELFHHKTAAAVHKEGPERRVAAARPVPGPQQVKEEGEEDLIQKTVHSEEKEAEQVRQPLVGGSPGAPATARSPPPPTGCRWRPEACRGGGRAPQLLPPLVPQVQEALQEHLAVVERQRVLQGQVQRPRRRCAPRPADPAEQRARQGLQPHVGRGVEEEIEDEGAGAAPLLQVDFLQGQVGERVQEAAVGRGEAQHPEVRAASEAARRGQEHVQGDPVHPVEVEAHPSGQRGALGRRFSSGQRLRAAGGSLASPPSWGPRAPRRAAPPRGTLVVRVAAGHRLGGCPGARSHAATAAGCAELLGGGDEPRAALRPLLAPGGRAGSSVPAAARRRPELLQSGDARAALLAESPRRGPAAPSPPVPGEVPPAGARAHPARPIGRRGPARGGGAGAARRNADTGANPISSAAQPRRLCCRLCKRNASSDAPSPGPPQGPLGPGRPTSPAFAAPLPPRPSPERGAPRSPLGKARPCLSHRVPRSAPGSLAGQEALAGAQAPRGETPNRCDSEPVGIRFI